MKQTDFKTTTPAMDTKCGTMYARIMENDDGSFNGVILELGKTGC